MEGKTAIGTVSDYMKQKDDMKVLTEGTEVIENIQNKILEEAIKETDQTIMTDLEQIKLRQKMFDTMMAEYKPILTGPVTEKAKRIEDMEFTINKILDLYFTSNDNKTDEKSTNTSISLNDIPEEIIQKDSMICDKFPDLIFNSENCDFYVHRLYDNDISTDNIKFNVISNDKQAIAMNDYFEIVHSLVPDKYNFDQMDKYRKNICRPLFLYRKSNRSKNSFLYPEIQSLLRHYKHVARCDGVTEFDPYVYLYTGREQVEKLDKIGLSMITDKSNEVGNKSISYTLHNGISYTLPNSMGTYVYIGFHTWLEYLIENAYMLIDVKKSMSWLEKIAYKDTVRMIDCINHAIEVAFSPSTR